MDSQEVTTNAQRAAETSDSQSQAEGGVEQTLIAKSDDYPAGGQPATTALSVPQSGGLSLDDIGGSQSISNFPTDAKERWLLEAIATGADVCVDDDRMNVDIPVKYWYIHVVSLEGDEPGEVNDCFRTVLITPDNDAYAFVSVGVAQDIARIAKAFGVAPYDSPVVVRAKRERTRKGFAIIKLSPVLATGS